MLDKIAVEQVKGGDTNMDQEKMLSDKILEMLDTYPGISLSMLHYVMNAPAALWRPLFEKMCRNGQIVKVTVRRAANEWSGHERKLYHKFFSAADVSVYEQVITQTHNLDIIS